MGILLLAVLAIGLMPAVAFAAQVSSSGFSYTVNGSGQVTIWGYEGSLTDIEIPSEIDGCQVVAIATGAFERESSLISVKIPEGVTGVGMWAFAGCSSLERVELPSTLIKVGEYAFDGCSSLKRVDLPSSVEFVGYYAFRGCSLLEEIGSLGEVEFIGGYAFSGCSSLKSVSIPESVTKIYTHAFDGCSSLESVDIPESVTRIYPYAFSGCSSLESVAIPEGVASIEDNTFSVCSSLETVGIPDSVTSIGKGAFAQCTLLSDIDVPDSVVYIGPNAFFYCKSLKSFTVPEGVTLINDSVFSGCSSLESVSILGEVTYVGQEAFGWCTSLADVALPESVISIGNRAFICCSSLEGIDIPLAVTYIGDEAFQNCSLEEITIPASVTEIGAAAFANCSELTSINVDSGNSSYHSRDGVLFTSDGSELLCYPAGKSEEEYGIPEGVVSLGSGAFDSCLALKNVGIPSTVASIGDDAFHGCQRLERVSLPDSVTSIGDYAFCYCLSLGSIVVPKGVTSIGECAFDVIGWPGIVYVSTQDQYSLLAGNDNYIDTDSMRVVLRKDISSTSVTLSNARCIYNGMAQTPSVVVECSGVTLVESVDYEVAYADNVSIGSATATVTGLGGYTGAETLSFEILSNCVRFSDTPAGAWYVTNGTLDYVIARGIMSGTSETTFEPGGQVTRAQVATILYNLTGRPAVGEAEVFSDVEPGAWYHDAVMWARSAGVVSGYDDGSFRPGVSVTREQLACMLRNYAGNVAGLDVAVGAGGLGGFADAASVSPWACDSVAWCVGRGIIAGTPSGGSVFVNPQGTAVRAEAAQMVRTFDEKVLVG